jgi:hypothetical protein
MTASFKDRNGHSAGALSEANGALFRFTLSYDNHEWNTRPMRGNNPP